MAALITPLITVNNAFPNQFMMLYSLPTTTVSHK